MFLFEFWVLETLWLNLVFLLYMKQIIRVLSAPWLMGGLFIILAAAMAMATFVENDYGTPAAKALVYNAWWFELIFFVLAVNMLGNIFNYKLWRWEKASVLLFHVSFFLILAGAAITRYIGYEGLLHIREGEEAHVMMSYDPHVAATLITPESTAVHEALSLTSPATPTHYRSTLRAGGEKVKIKSVAFVPNATAAPREMPGGKPLAGIVFSGMMERQETFLSPGEFAERAGFIVAFEPDTTLRPDVIIRRAADGIGVELIAGRSFVARHMGEEGEQEMEAGFFYPFAPGQLYDFGRVRLALSRYHASAIMQPVAMPGGSDQGLPHAVVFDVRHRGVTHQLIAYGRSGMVGEPYTLKLPGATLVVRYGALPIELPFAIRLNKFILERYPGSQSPSGYKSEVILLDESRGVEKPYTIFMNNILSYRGYRLYQSSYDKDEKGTVLSVNHDGLGTFVTYLGYFLMSLGMIWALFARNTRFRILMNQVDRIHRKRKSLAAMFLILITLPVSAQGSTLPPAPDKELSAAFGSLWVQDNGGRIKPLNSLHQEIVLKLVKHNTFQGMTADQMILGIFTHPMQWQHVPLITVKDPQLRNMLGITHKKASFSDFFDGNRHYKIHQMVDAANRQNPSMRNKLEQEVIKIDEQVNVFYLTQMGHLHKLFPSSLDLQLPWYTPASQPTTLSNADSLFVVSSLSDFIGYVRTSDSVAALEQLKLIGEYQQSHSEEILPTQLTLRLELLYNRLNVFMWLATFFFGLGAVLLLLQFASLLRPSLSFKWVMRIGYTLLFAGFLYHTFGLILRWLIAGHAPWSNGYESMIFIGWCILLAGFVMARKSSMVLPITGVFTGVVLMVAHLSWMNPHITNLVPVLQSYWLTLHVSIIIGGYGFLALGALLGFLNLVIMVFRTKRNIMRLQLTVDELTAINEMALTVGLYLMTIGSFIGGVWANESWGRYWGWDPKETWSLITIVLYAFILHMRFVPGLKGSMAFNIGSLITFSSVIMTYLGVNYYLAGLHSYAGGDPVPIPAFVWYTLAVVIALIYMARKNEQKYLPLRQKHSENKQLE